MSVKQIDPDDSYIVRELFACSAGHFLPPGFTYWEAGECCPHGHSDGEDPHLYWRLMMVPTKASDGKDMWRKLLDHPDRWGQFPLAPEGLKEGMRVGTREKVRASARKRRRARRAGATPRG